MLLFETLTLGCGLGQFLALLARVLHILLLLEVGHARLHLEGGRPFCLVFAVSNLCA